MDIKKLAEENLAYAIEMRRLIHAHPELSWQEEETTKLVMTEMDKQGIPYLRPAKTGLIAIIQGTAVLAPGRKGKVVGLRADMDALPILEANEVPYKSQNSGVMHACGHDTHVASLLAAAKILNQVKDQFCGTVKLIFQPAEEYFPSGALAMMEKGDLGDVEAFLGTHVNPELPTGQISVEPGPRMACSASIDIKVAGKGGHGGNPHTSVDAIVAASAIVMNLQTLVSRELPMNNTAVVSIGTFQAGTGKNIVAEEAVLSGTCRFFDPALEEGLRQAATRVAENTAQAFRATANVTITPGLPPVLNDAKLAALAKAAVEKLWGEGAIGRLPKSTGVEDFAYYARQAPSMFAFFGGKDSKKAENAALHNSRFDVDERCMMYASSLYAQFAVDYLQA